MQRAPLYKVVISPRVLEENGISPTAKITPPYLEPGPGFVWNGPPKMLATIDSTISSTLNKAVYITDPTNPMRFMFPQGTTIKYGFDINKSIVALILGNPTISPAVGFAPTTMETPASISATPALPVASPVAPRTANRISSFWGRGGKERRRKARKTKRKARKTKRKARKTTRKR